jgi:hypothetical protein
VIVVDNGSPPGFEKTLAQLPPEVTLLRHPVGNPYSARNLGVEHASGEFIFFTDADAVPRAGWIAAGLRAFEEGADIVNGYSGSIGSTRVERLIQAPFDDLCAASERGSSRVPVNTRNAAVRASVFRTLRFDPRFARGGDGCFGRLARLAGFRLFFEPAMVAAHSHERELVLMAAKGVCWGWNGQRLTAEVPAVDPSPGPWLPRGKAFAHLTRAPVLRVGAACCWQLAYWNARFVQVCGAALPFQLSRWLFEKVSMPYARRAGMLLYADGRADQPTPSELLRRTLRRD